jgi:hypothetical protein
VSLIDARQGARGPPGTLKAVRTLMDTIDRAVGGMNGMGLQVL